MKWEKKKGKRKEGERTIVLASLCSCTKRKKDTEKRQGRGGEKGKGRQKSIKNLKEKGERGRLLLLHPAYPGVVAKGGKRKGGDRRMGKKGGEARGRGWVVQYLLLP